MADHSVVIVPIAWPTANLGSLGTPPGPDPIPAASELPERHPPVFYAYQMHLGGGPLSVVLMLASRFTNRCAAEFAIVDFEFARVRRMLVNLNSTADGQGQLVSIRGRIDEDHLPQIDGPRAVFKPDRDNVSDLLTEYAYAGGSHHLALVPGAGGGVGEGL